MFWVCTLFEIACKLWSYWVFKASYLSCIIWVFKLQQHCSIWWDRLLMLSCTPPKPWHKELFTPLKAFIMAICVWFAFCIWFTFIWLISCAFEQIPFVIPSSLLIIACVSNPRWTSACVPCWLFPQAPPPPNPKIKKNKIRMIIPFPSRKPSLFPVTEAISDNDKLSMCVLLSYLSWFCKILF